MTTRRQLIQSLPALPLFTAAGATALLAACGKKENAVSTSPAPVSAAPSPAPSPAPAPAAATETAQTPAATAPSTTAAATGSLVDEKDAQALALGYVAVASKVDKAKYPKYADGQACSNCALYQGGAAEQGGCPLFPGKQVLGKAWCSAYAKKGA